MIMVDRARIHKSIFQCQTAFGWYLYFREIFRGKKIVLAVLSTAATVRQVAYIGSIQIPVFAKIIQIHILLIGLTRSFSSLVIGLVAEL
jgi:hypothetical protein